MPQNRPERAPRLERRPRSPREPVVALAARLLALVPSRSNGRSSTLTIAPRTSAPATSTSSPHRVVRRGHGQGRQNHVLDPRWRKQLRQERDPVPIDAGRERRGVLPQVPDEIRLTGIEAGVDDRDGDARTDGERPERGCVRTVRTMPASPVVSACSHHSRTGRGASWSTAIVDEAAEGCGRAAETFANASTATTSGSRRRIIMAREGDAVDTLFSSRRPSGDPRWSSRTDGFQTTRCIFTRRKKPPVTAAPTQANAHRRPARDRTVRRIRRRVVGC